MKKELEKTYNPADIEDRLYSKWVGKKYFHAEVDNSNAAAEYNRSAAYGTCA